jgi:alpha-glucosidase (family GH31 glycosyl hydrolase)
MKNVEQGFYFSDQFIQIVFNLGYKSVYGFGENTHNSFKHKYSYDTWWGVFARDQPPGGDKINLYGTHPFLMAVNEKTGRAMGMLILNSNAQEYSFLPPNALSYRTLGGILDIYIMEESSPEQLIQTYTMLIGVPYFPP